MSQATQGGRQDVLDQLRRDFDPWQKSAQARYHAADDADWADYRDRYHNDGEKIYQTFSDSDGHSITPFHKVLKRLQRAAERAEAEDKPAPPAYRFPEVFLATLIHVDDADLWALERGDMDYFDGEQHCRKKVMEWCARPENEHVLEALEDGGTEIHAHSKPGGGKTSMANFLAGVRMPEINNETVMWMLTLDELECLPLAPFMTICAPEGVDLNVQAKPKDPVLPSVDINLTDVFRDVLTYEDPVDLWDQVVPGGLYAVLPDPQFRRCTEITTCQFTPASAAGETDEVTPLVDFAHAVMEVRAKDDEFLHHTTMIIDEFGDLLPLNPEADENDTRKKVKRYPKTYGKARKKNLGVWSFSHAMQELDDGIRHKQRWFATMPKTPSPSSSLAGINCPLKSDYTDRLSKGEATIWRANHFVDVSWPNPYRQFRFNGEISIDYPERRRALRKLGVAP